MLRKRNKGSMNNRREIDKSNRLGMQEGNNAATMCQKAAAGERKINKQTKKKCGRLAKLPKATVPPSIFMDFAKTKPPMNSHSTTSWVLSRTLPYLRPRKGGSGGNQETIDNCQIAQRDGRNEEAFSSSVYNSHQHPVEKGNEYQAKYKVVYKGNQYN